MNAPPRRAVVVGAGIVGLAVAERLTEHGLQVVVLEKEDAPARHQSGRNSGVLHTGLYYRPGSLKARLCASGARLMAERCEAAGLPLARTGKVVVATTERELPRLDELERRGRANGVELERVGPERLAEIEPHARCVQALAVPGAAAVDYARVTAHLAAAVTERGAVLCTGASARALEQNGGEVVVRLADGEALACDLAFNCAGLFADRVARASGVSPRVRIVPFRGEYHELVPAARELVRGAIYPVPDPALPFLGVHFTRTVDGRVLCGPSAVLALAREGYRWRDVSPRDLAETVLGAGTARLFARHWRTGLGELARSFSRHAYARELAELVPAVRAADLVPAPAGVRAQAVGPDGELVDDFELVRTGRVVHVLNAPSPAATAALAIARELVDPALERDAGRRTGSSDAPRPE